MNLVKVIVQLLSLPPTLLHEFAHYIVSKLYGADPKVELPIPLYKAYEKFNERDFIVRSEEAIGRLSVSHNFESGANIFVVFLFFIAPIVYLPLAVFFFNSMLINGVGFNVIGFALFGRACVPSMHDLRNANKLGNKILVITKNKIMVRIHSILN